ncbi:MAG TPA: maleylpyruvate isomerase family mycothiol-dependent enzyme, partial [Chloroflexota bacterium]
MDDDAQTQPEPVRLPVAPVSVRNAAISELTHVNDFVQTQSAASWGKSSAVPEWTVGDVVTHLNLAIAVYNRLVGVVLAGKGSGGIWRAMGKVSEKIAPVAMPAFNAVNRSLPRMIDRALSPEVIRAQFSTSARNLREQLMRVGPEDYSRPVYYAGGPWPLSFFLSAVVDELAVHGWDMASPTDPLAHLSAEARQVIPHFFWSGTPFLLHLPKGTAGTVQVSIVDPSIDLWWQMEGGKAIPRVGKADKADATCTGEAGTLALVLAGRIKPEDAVRTTSLRLEGDEALARTFLRSWRI